MDHRQAGASAGRHLGVLSLAQTAPHEVGHRLAQRPVSVPGKRDGLRVQVVWQVHGRSHTRIISSAHHDAVALLAAQAISEGRGAVQGLRDSTTLTNDLPVALSTLGGELGAEENKNPPVFAVDVEGEPRDLRPILRDEVYRIAGEALRNAFHHAQARRVELEIRYDKRQFRLRVRDDGKGIDPKLLNENGCDGHYGLRGMRERAKLMGGKLAVWSELDSGTEVELNIPASRAYEIPPAGRRWWLAEKLSGKKMEVES